MLTSNIFRSLICDFQSDRSLSFLPLVKVYFTDLPNSSRGSPSSPHPTPIALSGSTESPFDLGVQDVATVPEASSHPTPTGSPPPPPMSVPRASHPGPAAGLLRDFEPRRIGFLLHGSLSQFQALLPQPHLQDPPQPVPLVSLHTPCGPASGHLHIRLLLPGMLTDLPRAHLSLHRFSEVPFQKGLLEHGCKRQPHRCLLSLLSFSEHEVSPASLP